MLKQHLSRKWLFSGKFVNSQAECRFTLGHIKLESTARYLGIEVGDALQISEQIEL